MPDEIQVSISQASVKQIIEAKVQTAVAEALKPHGNDFVDSMVREVLLAKSGDEKYRYANDRDKPTVLGHMVNKIIEEEARKALVEWAEKNRPLIAKRMQECIAKNPRFAATVADSLVQSLAEAMQHAWNFKVHVEYKATR